MEIRGTAAYFHVQGDMPRYFQATDDDIVECVNGRVENIAVIATTGRYVITVEDWYDFAEATSSTTSAVKRERFVKQ